MSTNSTTDLQFHASGFIVKVHGVWTEKALNHFRDFLKLRGLAPSDDELMTILRQAKERYLDGHGRLSVCAAEPCHAKTGFDLSDTALESAATEAGLPISLTGCQGPCKQAPVLSLRIADRSEFFAQVASARDWQAILEFARQARTAGTLMTNAGSAEPFRFDPVHDHLKPSVHLTPLQFLLGHFRGQGKYTMTPYTFHKEVIGTPEAGGRFIALRMGVSYPLVDGRTDVHNALVMVGAQASPDRFFAHAYSDAGIFRQYSVEGTEGGLKFDDLPPGHANQWRRARKVLRPTPAGFEEQLEVDGGEGFVPYYIISMRRVAGRPSSSASARNDR
jgi:hypothetical protein